MITFDTNLLVRLAVNDDEQQAAIAEQLLEENQVFVPRTVLLETEWVLRSVYKQSRSDIADFFEVMLMTDNLIAENALEVGLAVEWYKLGADFADAIHLCMTGDRVMHTFDGRFCKKARELEITPGVVIMGVNISMKLRAKHSGKFLSVPVDGGYATQQCQDKASNFIFDEVKDGSGFGRLILAETFQSQSQMCLQSSSMNPRDGWLVNLAPYQEGNESQLWCFIGSNEKGFIIKNKKERAERGVQLKESCLNVCEAKTTSGTPIITYHITKSRSAENELWFQDEV